MMADLLGKQVGDYRLLHFLGNGTFGDVYEGVHVHLETHVAVKLLKGSFTEVEIKKFLDEARILSRLEHPNIVRIFTFSVAMLDELKLPFLAMSLAPNGTLLNPHPRGTSLPLTTIVMYVKQIASALQYAHNNKYIHRDVKPENILLGKNDELLLSDFGIAVVAHSTLSLESPNVGGTLPYMAPEQLEGKPQPASDQYALGIIVYEWLCGERPFKGTAAEIMRQHMLTPPPPLRGKVPMLSPDVEQVVMKALAKDPQQRFGSVQAFATALEQAAHSAQPASFAPLSQWVQPTVAPSNQSPLPFERKNYHQERAARTRNEQELATRASRMEAPYVPSANSYALQVNPISPPMPPSPGLYVQPPAAKAKHKRNKRILVVGGIGGGAAVGGVEIGIFAAGVAAFGGGVIERLIAGAILGAIAGAILGAIAGAISLVVIRKLAGKEALAFSGGKEVGIVTIAGIVAGAVTPLRGSFAILAQLAVAVVVGVVAGALVARNVRKKRV